HPVADLALVLLVMRLEFGRLLDVLLVLRMLLEGLHPNDDGLVHLVADDGAGARLAHRPFHHRFLIGHAVSSAVALRRRGLGEPGAAVGAAPGAGFTDGAAPGAALGPRAGAAAAAPALAAAPPAMPSPPSPGFSSSRPLSFTSAPALTPDLMPRVRVFMGSL